jgi:hypothetical protein
MAGQAVIDTERFAPGAVATDLVSDAIESSVVVASQVGGWPEQDAPGTPPCLWLARAQRMLERLDAYTSYGKPSHDCCIAA